LLLEIAEVEENVVLIDPSEFAFRYIENANVIQFFQAAGVNLDLFYRLLWRHVLVVELLRKRFRLAQSNDSAGFLDQINQWVKFNPGRKAAMDYLRRWGEKFWETSEVRARELTSKFEQELSAHLSVPAGLVSLGAKGAERLESAERAEIVSRGNEVVNGIQIRELREVISLIGEKVFNDGKVKYFVVIDKLDENWAKAETRYRLIRALIEEIRSFRALSNVKILCALRHDLLLEVLDATRDEGFQEEKFQDYYLQIRWSQADLVRLLDLRVKQLYRRHQRSLDIGISDILPTVKRGRPEPATYIIQRTLSRPRDAIAFVNECLRLAEDRERISWKVIRAAEGRYSDRRLKALQYEWRTHYPSIDFIIDVLREAPSTFSRNQIQQDRVDQATLSCAQLEVSEDPCVKIAHEFLNPASKKTGKDFLNESLRVLYKVGLIGVRFRKNEPVSWAFSHEDELSAGDVKRAISYHVHKMGWRGLGTRIISSDEELQVEEEE